MLTRSLYRLVFRPSASPVVLVDWGDLAEIPGLPWEQKVQVEPLLAAASAWFAARGNVNRTWRIQRVRGYASAQALHTGILAEDAALSALSGVTADFEVRVLTQPDPGGTITARTAARYVAARAAIASVQVETEQPLLRATWTYALQLGPLASAAP